MSKHDHELQIQWVMDANGKPWSAANAPEGAKYFCCECGKLLKRRGKGAPLGRTRHFAHLVKTQCSGETDKHRLSKLWIAALLRRNIGNTMVSCQFQFWNDDTDEREAIPELPDYDEVRVERGLENGLRPDVSLWKSGICVFGIEVRNTHAVDAVKAESLGISWIEVLAESDLQKDTAFEVVNGSDDYFPVLVLEHVDPAIPEEVEAILAPEESEEALDFEKEVTTINPRFLHRQAFVPVRRPAAPKPIGIKEFAIGLAGFAAIAVVGAHYREAPLYHLPIGKKIRRFFGERTWFEKLLGV